MAVLVCGGAGYIGSHNVRALLERGETPVVLDNFLTGHRASVPQGVRLYTGDMRDPALLDAVFTEQPIEAVLHFAACSLVGESMEQPLRYFQNNIHGMMVLLEAMVRHGVDKIVFSSTASVYGEPDAVPIPETAPLRPTNPYGESKLAMERMMVELADAHMRAVDYLRAGGASEVCNLGNGTGFSVRQMVEAAQRVTGREIAVSIGARRPGDPARLVASAQRANDVLGWTAHADIDSIIASAWAWHSRRPDGFEE